MDLTDMGTCSTDSVDYPDFANAVAQSVSEEQVDEGILICTTGIGMSIAANRYPGVRAALVNTPSHAKTARTHNNANILALGTDSTTQEMLESILDAWFGNHFDGGRHSRRLDKLETLPTTTQSLSAVFRIDPEIYRALRREQLRQSENLELIASENIASRAVREAQGSLLTNKYAEGYPGKRWYGGCEHVDVAEQLAINRAKEVFGAEYVNVQPHSGSGANMGVYFAMLQPGDKMLTMDLSHGGHLTHGNAANFSGKFFDIVHYGVRESDHRIDYDQLAAMCAISASNIAPLSRAISPIRSKSISRG